MPPVTTRPVKKSLRIIVMMLVGGVAGWLPGYLARCSGQGGIG